MELSWNPLELTVEQAEDIIYENSERFTCIDRIDHGKNGRWHNLIQIIFKDKLSEKCYSIYYHEGATEDQENEIWPGTKEVEQKEVKIYRWFSVVE